MAEVLAEFTDIIVSDDQMRYHAHACGAEMPGGMWEGWLEFVPVDGGAPVRSPRETTQPNREAAVYWATGLTAVYAEGSLRRALGPPIRRPVAEPAQPLFDGPAPAVVATTVDAPLHEAVLDPFSVYEKGEPLLRRELGALSAWHLVNIIVAYGLSDEPVTTLNRLPGRALIDRIVAGVRDRLPARR
jgi:hypothetical protein